MSRRPENDDASLPDSSRPGGLATVLRNLAISKPIKAPPPMSASSAALPRAELINAMSTTSPELSTNHMDAFELLKHGTPSERISAANTLKYAITEYPLNPILDIWYAGKDLINPSNSSLTRAAGWELLTECAKYSSSTDLERKEFFQTLSAPANPEDFHLQLAALVDLTNHGRVLAGFDYDLLPLLTTWLQDVYNAARAARKSSHLSRSAGGGPTGAKLAASGEDKNFAQLFSFILDVIKFSFNTADEPAVTDLIHTVLTICMNTSQEDDLRSCINVLDAIVTFGFIPQTKLKDCVQVLSSIYSMVPALQKSSWHTISNLCRSHNGPATIRVMLDILRNLQHGANDKDLSREIRGSLAVLQKLLSKPAGKGYPTVPYALLVDGLSNTSRTSKSLRVHVSILQLLNTLFDHGEGHVHRLIIDEDWSTSLDVAADCYRRISDMSDRQPLSHEEAQVASVERELVILIQRLDAVMKEKSGDFIPRQTIIDFFANVNPLLPDETAKTVLDYFQEFWCCSPSDLNWEENLNLVLEAFFSNRNRSSDTRLRALQATMDAYEIVDLVGDGAEQNFIPRLAKSVLQNIVEEGDVLVLDAIMSLMVSVAVSCDMELFDFIVEALRTVVVSHRLRSPILSPAPSTAISPTSMDAPMPRLAQVQSPSNVVTTAYVRMFLRIMNSHSEKSVRLYTVLVDIAKQSQCELNARLTAMRLLFRLRADWAHRVFVTDDLDNTFLATVMCRTDASYAKKQAEEAAQSLRLSRGEHGTPGRASRGVSLGQTQFQERATPVGTPSGGKGLLGRQYQLWKYPDLNALPGAIPNLISPVLVSRSWTSEASDDEEEKGEEIHPTDKVHRASVLSMGIWLDTVLDILQGSDWEIYSFALVHLPAQLSNHGIFSAAIPQIKTLRRIICEQIRTNGFQEPPFISGLRRVDVAICLFHSLTMILSYHEHFGKGDEDEIVKTFIIGIGTWERTAKYCIHALSICCHELPLSTSKSLVQMLNQMAASITQPQVSVHILEFLACLSRLHDVYVNFREDEYRIVFAICFRYLEYARDKRQSNRSSHNSEPNTPGTPGTGGTDASQPAAPFEELPQYVHALAYHVILYWFLALKLPDRATHVGWIARKLFADSDNVGPTTADEHALTSIDFMQRVAYADVGESSEDPFFTEDRFGDIVRKQWLIGNSIVTVKQATTSGWAQIIKRQPSGTSAYTIRETFKPPPLHQKIENYVDVSREGQASTNVILPSHVLLQLMSPVPQSFESARPIPLPDEEAIDRAIRIFDRSSSVDSHKVGVIYIGEEQTGETEILANVCGSSDYTDFLNNLGTLTRLKGATFNTQGLDREYDTDGRYTFCWRDRVTEVVFHVTTQMPTDLERDARCTLKKRHIGNDFVNIIFNDSGKPFKFDTFPSQFNYVNIVITPASRASFIATRTTTNFGGLRGQPFYRVQVLSKPGFPEISPASETKMISLNALPGFVRLVALNASVFCHVWNAREGGEHISSWSGRLREIKRLRERYGPRAMTNTVPSPPPCSSSQQAQPSESSRPGSSVRDSFSSLRRTSVATFFTSTSEQASHRSSVLSTTASTNDTETGHTNGVGPLVESVDFSKWA